MQFEIRRVLLAALVAASFLPQLALAQAPKPGAKAPQPAQIDRNGVLILIRSSLLALDQANKTGNYSVLRDLSAPGFQEGNTTARLAEIFAGLRNGKVDLSGVAVLEPQLSLLPQIEPNGMMHMAGFFPSVPTQVRFELLYAPVSGQWRLMGISVTLGESSPAAPIDKPSAADQKKLQEGLKKRAEDERKKSQTHEPAPAPPPTSAPSSGK